jgi:transposase
LTLPPKNVSLAEVFQCKQGERNDEGEIDEGTLHARVQAGAVRLVESGQTVAAAARTLGLVEQTLFNWVKAQRLGELKGTERKTISAEQMEISRLRAELARVKMERDILGKATAYFAKAQS